MHDLNQARFDLDQAKEKRDRIAAEPINFEGMSNSDQRTAAINEKRDRLDTANAMVDDLEIRYKNVLENQPEPVVRQPVADVNTENRELVELRKRVSFRSYLEAADAQTAIRGAEKEYNTVFLGNHHKAFVNDRGGSVLPLELLVYSEEEHKDLQERDVTNLTATSADTADVQTYETLRRLFSGTVVEFLRASYVSVGPGVQSFRVFATGLNDASATVAKSAAIAATDTSFTASTVAPLRFGGAYDVHFEDAALMGGITDLQRQDLLDVLRYSLDKKAVGIIVGQIANATNTQTSGGDTFATYTAIPAQYIDSIFAPTVSDMNILLPLGSYKHAEGMFSTVTEMTAIEKLAQRGVQVRGTDYLTLSSNAGSAIVVKGTHEGPVVPVWGGVNITTDDVTAVRDGDIRLTAFMFMNAKVRRPGVLAKHTVATA